MRANTIIALAGALLLIGSASAAAAECCTHEKMDHSMACCHQEKAEQPMACCGHGNDPFAAAVLLPKVFVEPARPAVERVLVTFWNPVRVGDHILMGKYVIEHDTDRMAAGGPCTYIYDVKDQRLPVVAFHCTHLDRPHRDRPTVTLVPTGEPNDVKRLTEFQFGGEAAGHGVPARR